MSTSYRVLLGDTPSTISVKFFGSESRARAIVSANPGALFVPGETITIPAAPGTPAAQSFEGVQVYIDGRIFEFWTDIEINVSIDRFSTVQLRTPFDPSNRQLREVFRPFSYRPLSVFVSGVLLFNGVLVTVDPAVTDREAFLDIGGYALPGVLQDCTPPASSYPIEYNGLTLKQIAEEVAEPFGLAVDFRPAPGPVFERVAAGPGRSALNLLTGLAKQRGYLITNNSAGALSVTSGPTASTPVARLEEGAHPVRSVTPTFNPQQYYSTLTGLEPTVIGSEGSQFTVKNPHLAGVVRPYTFEPGDATAGNVSTAVKSQASRMFGNMVAYAVSVPGFTSPGGLWAPGGTVTLKAPLAMVYRDYDFIIRSVTFQATAGEQSCVLDLTLPGAFSQDPPGALPWSE